MERLIEYTKITLDTTNWRRVLLAAFMVALKAWEDLAVRNFDFIGFFRGSVSIKDLNQLEMTFLALIQYKVFMKASMYARYYFQLKLYSRVDEAHFPIKPLTVEKAATLETHSHSSEVVLQRSRSTSQLRPRYMRAQVIN